jgi:hypothetical protein
MTEKYGDEVAVVRAEYDMKLAQVVRRTSKSKERPNACSLCVDSISPYDKYVYCKICSRAACLDCSEAKRFCTVHKCLMRQDKAPTMEKATKKQPKGMLKRRSLADAA